MKKIACVLLVVASLVGCNGNPSPSDDAKNPMGTSVTDPKPGEKPVPGAKGKAAMPPTGKDGIAGV